MEYVITPWAMIFQPMQFIDSVDQDINLDFKENSVHQESLISEVNQILDKSYFHEIPELQSHVDTDKLEQAYLDKILKSIQMKALKVLQLVLSVKETQQNIWLGHTLRTYIYNLQRVNFDREAIRTVDTLAENIHLNKFIAKAWETLLALPETYPDKSLIPSFLQDTKNLLKPTWPLKLKFSSYTLYITYIYILEVVFGNFKEWKDSCKAFSKD